MDTINIFKTRSFWATAAAVVSGVEQSGDGFTGILGAAAGVAQAVGIIPDAGEAVSTIGPAVTALLGCWAYAERLRGKKKVVMR